MKILYLTNIIPWPVNNGKKMRIISFLKSLGEYHHLDLVCLDSEKVKERVDYQDLYKFIDKMEIVEPPCGLLESGVLGRVRHLFSNLPYTVLRYKSNEMKNYLEKILNYNKYDCIISDGVHISINLPFSANVPIILNEHNIEYILYKRYIKNEKNIVKRLYAYLELKKLLNYEQSMWNKVDQCIVCSAIDKKLINKFDQNVAVKVIPNTVEIEKYGLRSQESPFNLAFVGAFDWIPNRDAVLFFCAEIYPLIKKEIPEVTFTVIGKNPSNEIRNLGERDKSITVTGTVNDVRTFLSRSQLVVVPLRMGSGTRLKIIEAMAMKKAVISTSIGAEGIDVKDGENILIADDPIIFAWKVVELLKNKNLRLSLGQRGHELVLQKYDMHTIPLVFQEIFSRRLCGNEPDSKN